MMGVAGLRRTGFARLREPCALRGVLVLALLAPGCTSPPGPRTYSPTDERPRVGDDARWWEAKANKELERGNSTEDMATRRKHYDTAIRDLKAARDLYYDELEKLEHAATKTDPVPAGRRQALDVEIERLSRQIDQLYKERPVE